MVLAIVDQLGKLIAYGFDVVEAWERHIAIEVSGGWTWVNREDFYRRVSLLEFNGHHTHHGILRSLAGNVSQGMPVWTDL